MIEPEHPQISLQRQCELVGLNRSSWYYEAARETPENEWLMQLIDQQFTQTPFYGVRRMTAWLRQQGYAVNPKRVRRLMKKMGLVSVYPKPKLSLPGGDCKLVCVKGQEIRSNELLTSTHTEYDFSTRITG